MAQYHDHKEQPLIVELKERQQQLLLRQLQRPQRLQDEAHPRLDFLLQALLSQQPRQLDIPACMPLEPLGQFDNQQRQNKQQRFETRAWHLYLLHS